MVKPATDSVSYYNRRAADFAAQTADLDLGPLYHKFLGHVRPGGRILDAGCGVGRDTLAFVCRGYDVVAFDAAEEEYGETRLIEALRRHAEKSPESMVASVVEEVGRFGPEQHDDITLIVARCREPVAIA